MKRHFRLCYLTVAFVLAALMCISGSSFVYAASSYTPKTISEQSVNKTDTVTGVRRETKSVSNKFRIAYSQSALELAKKIIKDRGKGKNLLLSPDSILTVLTMTELGASGSTRKEMEKGLGQGIGAVSFSKFLAGYHKYAVTSGSVDKHAIYQIADSIWYRKGEVTPKTSFLKKVASFYDADIYEAPFDNSTVSDINNWVHNGTRGMISKILDRLERDQNMVLINATAFEGLWREPFGEAGRKVFTGAKGGRKKVPMISGTADRYVKIKGAQGMMKFYKGNKFAFLALLPPKGTSAEKYLSSLKGKDLVNGIRASKKLSSGVVVHVTMPQFKFDCTMSLNKVLRKMGVKKAFTRQADFSGICPEPLMIDDVLHKTVIELDKNGTKAAAVTAVIMKAGAMLTKTIHLKLNRPFVFAIVDAKHGLPVFLGILNNP